MVWGGNRYVVIFVGGGGTQKRSPKWEKNSRYPPPPHMVKNVPNIEKNAAKSPSHGGKVAEALYKDERGPQMEKN